MSADEVEIHEFGNPEPVKLMSETGLGWTATTVNIDGIRGVRSVGPDYPEDAPIGSIHFNSTYMSSYVKISQGAWVRITGQDENGFNQLADGTSDCWMIMEQI